MESSKVGDKDYQDLQSPLCWVTANSLARQKVANKRNEVKKMLGRKRQGTFFFVQELTVAIHHQILIDFMEREKKKKVVKKRNPEKKMKRKEGKKGLF